MYIDRCIDKSVDGGFILQLCRPKRDHFRCAHVAPAAAPCPSPRQWSCPTTFAGAVSSLSLRDAGSSLQGDHGDAGAGS